MSILSSMDMPTIDVDLGPEKLEDEKQGGPSLHCDLCDTEVVYKLAQMFLPGLASACVDNTSGDLFKAPGSVAVDLRKEMIEYITQRSESFVAESVILEGGPDGEVSDHPFDIISNFVDDFVSSKRNLLSRVSGWLMSDKREDKIDDFVQELEINGFWTLDKREIISETLLKNVDFENSYHCSMSFNSVEELANHIDNCNFRSMICENQGCNSRFCAAHLKNHDSICPFKIIPCEQKCSDSIMRREMDRHCITVCPMKLVNCPFYTVGCRSAVSQCMIEKHRLDDLHSHLWHLLKGVYKKAYGDDIKRRVEQIVQASSSSRLAEARDVRSLSFIVKDIEAKLGPFKASAVEKNTADETVAKNGEGEGGETDMNSSEKTIKAEVSDMVNMNNAENTAKNEDREPSPVENKDAEERTQTSDVTNSSVKTEIGLQNDETKDAAASELKIKGNEESTQIHQEKLSTEEVRTQTSNMTNFSSDETEIGLQDDETKDAAAGELEIKGNEESTQTHQEQLSNEEVRTQTSNMTNFSSDETEIGLQNDETKDAAAGELEIKGNEESTQTHQEKLSNEEVRTQTSNMTNFSSDEPEIGLQNGETKDAAASELKIKDEECSAENSTQTQKEKLSNEEVSAINEGSADNSIKSKYNEDNKFEDKNNQQSIQNSEMETKGGAENNVKNKDVVDGDLKKSIQTPEV